MRSFAAVRSAFLVLAARQARARFAEGVTAYKRGDYATAFGEFRPLAEQGNANAQFALGVVYAEGNGVPQDYARAVTWYRKAAEQGNAVAQHNLGVMYGKGEGVRQDYAHAVTWYRRAAEQGNAVAQHNLGVMYGKGEGVPQDYVQAHKWFILSAAQDDAKAQEGRELTAGVMNPAQIAEAQRLAREWTVKHQR